MKSRCSSRWKVLAGGGAGGEGGSGKNVHPSAMNASMTCWGVFISRLTRTYLGSRTIEMQ